MAQQMTYGFLEQEIPSYLERTDPAFIAQIPNFVMLAENRIASNMKQQGFQTVVTGNFNLTPNLVKPTWWRETISFNWTDASGQRHQLYLREYEYLREFWPDTTQTGEPQYYADYNFNNFLLVPTPSAAFDFELVYYARLEPLDDTQQTNWLTVNAPQALLYACLMEASMWCKNWEQAAAWQAQYNQVRGDLLGEDRERIADRNIIAVKQ